MDWVGNGGVICTVPLNVELEPEVAVVEPEMLLVTVVLPEPCVPEVPPLPEPEELELEPVPELPAPPLPEPELLAP